MERNQSADGEEAAGQMATYSPAARKLLEAVRDLVRADRRMRRDLGTRMDLNSNELLALRHVMETTHEGAATTPARLAGFLDISTAATTTLLDRLVASGHLERRPHPTDRRSKVLVETTSAHQHVHHHLDEMHEEMRAVAEAVPPDAVPAVVGFLRSLAAVLDPPST
jgi:DNA-binding MarR family transcriptional regulator